MRIGAADVEQRAKRLSGLASPCRLCPQTCGASRESGEVGRCGCAWSPRIASYGSHFGEESVLVGRGGSGTVFFSGCSLACLFCQNWRISHGREGTDVTAGQLADVFLRVERDGCANLNLVTPTHQAHAILAALAIAREGGFDLPIVWNCGGYESVEALRCLDGVVDIYMPDLKYGDDPTAERLSGAPGYVTASQAALREMHRQVGNLMIGRDGVARRGLLVRHLVLPNRLAGTASVLQFLAAEISRDTAVNLMDQYRPCHQADGVEALGRRITRAEYAEAVEIARHAGLRRLG